MAKTVLLIDDLESQRLQMRQWLQHPEVTFLEAAGKRDAVRLASESQPKPDLVILDIVLADGNGYETCGILREILGAEVPIIIVSSRKREIDRQHTSMMGATGYVPKEQMQSRDDAMKALRDYAPNLAESYVS